MIALVLSVIALISGPLLYGALRKYGGLARAVENAIAGALVVLILVFLIPETWARIHYAGVLLLVAGYLLPGLLEKIIKTQARKTHAFTIVIAVTGLVLHSTLDGAGLATAGVSAEHSLPAVIVLHRFSIGMALWLMLDSLVSKRTRIIIVGIVAGATLPGYFFATSVLAGLESQLPYYLQALIMGMVIHGVLHRSHSHVH